jgi:homoserine O-acetyltransferase
MLNCFKHFSGTALVGVLFAAMSCAAQQTSAPATSEGDFVVHNFPFRSGESLPELRLHYTTLGKSLKDAAGHTTNAVLILHGKRHGSFLRPQLQALV